MKSKIQKKGKGKGTGGDVTDSMLEPIKIFRKWEKDYHAASTETEYLALIKRLDELIAKRTDYPDANALWGHCYIKVGDHSRALMEFDQAIQKDPKEPEHYNWAGFCHQELKQFEQALTHYSQAIDLDKTKGDYYFNRGTVKKDMNSYQEAIEDFEQAIKFWEQKSSSQSPEENIYQAFYLKGICLRQLEKYDESIVDLRKAVELKSDEPSAHNNLGLSLFKNGSFEEASHEYTKAIQTTQSEKKKLEYNPELRNQIAIYCNNRGLAYYHLKQYTEAKKDFDDAINLNDKEAIYYFNRGNVAYDQKKYEEAHQDYDCAIELQPSDPRFYHSKGLAYESTESDEDFDAAIENYKKAIELDETFFGARFHLGIMYHKNYQFKDALSWFSTVLTYYSTDKKIFVHRGLVYQALNEHKIAIMDFDSALKIDNTYSDAHYWRGVSNLKLENYDEAIKDLNTAQMHVVTHNFGIQDALGCWYQKKKDYDDALKFMNEAIEKDPQNVEFLMNRAQWYFELENYTDSIEDLERCLGIDEFDTQVLYKLGLSYYAFEKYKKSIKTLKRALKYKVNITGTDSRSKEDYKAIKEGKHLSYEPDIYYHIGIGYCNLEKFVDAIYPFTKAIEMEPNNVKYIHERAKAYQMIEEHESALKDFSDVIQMNPRNAHAYFRRAFTQKALKNYTEAADDFEKAKELDPDNQKLIVNYRKLSGVNCIVLWKPGEEKVYV